MRSRVNVRKEEEVTRENEGEKKTAVGVIIKEKSEK